MITEISQIENLAQEISEGLEEPLDIYMIGGGSMMYLGTKFTTKDVDFVVLTEREFRLLSDRLEAIGFKGVRPGAEYAKTNLSQMYVRESDDARVDVFETTVCRTLRLSDRMVGRSMVRYVSGKLRLHTCSGPDVFVFKTVTDRESDLSDCNELIRSFDFDWDLILNEIKRQISEGEGVWITYIADTLHELSSTFNANVTIMKEIDRMSDEFKEKWSDEKMKEWGLTEDDLK